LYNNTQNIVKASDFRSNDSIQLWLEERFTKLKARGAVTEQIRYVRKRSHKRVRGAIPLKFEELAKIRYAYFYEPTQCVADPRSLWTSQEDGAFTRRPSGLMELFAIIGEKMNKYFFLQRLRFLGHLRSRFYI
jgi:hypothetical protein